MNLQKTLSSLSLRAPSRNFGFPLKLLPGLFLSLLLCLLTTDLSAQWSGSVSSGGSDYSVVFNYSNAPANDCKCDQTGRDFSVPGVFTTPNISYNSDDYTVILGPNYDATWVVTLNFRGTETNSGCTCTEAPPLCVKRACDNTGGTNSIQATTAAIKNPKSLVASNEINGDVSLGRVLLSWQKGTDIPEVYIGYKIYRDNVLIATLPMGDVSYSYSDNNTAANPPTPNVVHTYKVVTYTNYWGGGHNSTGVTADGSTTTLTLSGSQGEFPTKVKLTWNSVSVAADEIRVERSKPTGGYEELSILSKHAEAYTDIDPIPGYLYTYRVSPVDENGISLLSLTKTAYAKPNGIVRGKVAALGGAGVQGVQVCVIPVNPVSPAGILSVPAGGYCSTTDAAGNYEVRGIYYFDSAAFLIVPSYPSHIFGPPSRTLNLELNTPIITNTNFTDSTSISIFGKVKFPPATAFGGTGALDIGIKDVAILLDTLDRGIRSKANGEWSYAVTNPGKYHFTAKFKDHDFDAVSPFADASGDTAVVIVTDQDIPGVDFIDQNIDSIKIRVQDGCGAPLAVTPNGNGSTPRVRITHDRGDTYFDKYVSVNAQGEATVVLPASLFNVKAQDDPPFVNPNIAVQLTDTTIKYDLSFRDSALVVTRDTTLDITPSRVVVVGGSNVTLPADTALVVDVDSSFKSLQPIADFVYFGPFLININFEDAGIDVFKGCTATGLGTSADSIIVMNVNGQYLLDIEIIDQYSGCPVDTGVVLTYDFVGDNERTPSALPIKKGHAYYEMIPGEPNVASGGANPYQKLFFVSVTAGVREHQDAGWWVLLQGAKDLTPTITTRSPEIPDLIVHDPPGDNSFAWVEKGSSYTAFTNTSYETSGSAGNYIDLIIGGKFKSSFGFLVETKFDAGIGLKVDFSYQAGRNNFFKTNYETTYTFEQTFSTSSDPLFTGHEGDIYVGKATNQLFSIAKVLDFDEQVCLASVVDKPSLAATGIATTFFYTEKHIKNVLLPQMDYLARILREDAATQTSPVRKEELIAESDSFRIDIFNWKQILAKNAYARDTGAVYERNQSFSAGATYNQSKSYDETAGSTYEYVEFIDINLALGVAWEIEGNGLWTEGKTGFGAWFRHSFTKDAGSSNTNTFKVGYELADKDIGDFFSVDILRDTAYNVPAFRVYGGTSSCPQEEGTQARDRANLNIFPPRIDNVPKGGTATFTAQMINESESQETREYQLRVIPQSNPGGAVVSMGGQNITNKTISYFLDAFQASEVDLTVQAGPRSANYENIAIMMFPPCEYELWENNGNLINGDTFYITANFESECSNVALINPTDNWLVNANNNDVLVTDFSGYDLNNPYLESVTLEYQPQNQGWLDGPTIYKSIDPTTYTATDSLDDLIFREFWDVSGLADGNYKIRARANCTAGKGRTVSSSMNGRIDRNSIAPFGIPTPSDGFLRFGQLISVKFDKDIDCGFTNQVPTYMPQITLTRTDNNTLIPLNIQCSQNEDQINLVPTIDLFSMPELEDVILIASVQGILDAQGNVQTYPIQWAFKVNASPVSWDPDSLNEAFAAGTAPTISSRLKNTAGLSKAFVISEYPAWLKPAVLSGSILSDGEYEVKFFVSPDLPIGMYRDTVVALIDGWPEYLDITYEAVAIPPNWKADPSDFIYSMSVVCVFSLDQTDTNLSRSDKDLIAAIYNGEIRGVGRLEYVERFNKYIAFLTVYSNIIANEEINFSLWRAANGIEYSAKESLYFADNAIYGRIGEPQIFHTDGVYQVIPLEKGWNWVSLNVDNTDMTVANLMSSLGSPTRGNDITIKRKDGATAQFTQIATPIIYGNQWTGPLAQLDNKQGYMLHLSDVPDTLRIPGTPISNFATIDVLNGWNWIGFQPQVAQPVGQALSSLNLRNQDLIKSREAFSEYHKGWDTWYGPLQFMEPGHGYKLKLKDGVSYNDLVFHNRTSKEDFQLDHTRFESSMTIVASIGFEDALAVGRGQLDGERLLIGAFVDDTCRGYGYLEWVEFMGDYRTTFSVHGNISDIGREMTFKVYDSYSGQEYICPNHPEKYISDYFLGEIKEPYVLFDRLSLPAPGYFLEQNYPNPYDSKTSIRFILPEAGQVKLTVFDQFGKTVKVLVDEELSAGEHTAVFEASKLPAGVYHYMIEAGEYRASRKMVKM